MTWNERDMTLNFDLEPFCYLELRSHPWFDLGFSRSNLCNKHTCISRIERKIVMEQKVWLCDLLGCWIQCVTWNLASPHPWLQGQIFRNDIDLGFPNLNLGNSCTQGMGDWHWMKGMWINRMLDSLCIIDLWPNTTYNPHPNWWCVLTLPAPHTTIDPTHSHHLPTHSHPTPQLIQPTHTTYTSHHNWSNRLTPPAPHTTINATVSHYLLTHSHHLDPTPQLVQPTHATCTTHHTPQLMQPSHTTSTKPLTPPTPHTTIDPAH